ncbi:MAG: hypothetical protein ACK50P_05575 [Planctomycetaceae bacterium]
MIRSRSRALAIAIPRYRLREYPPARPDSQAAPATAPGVHGNGKQVVPVTFPRAGSAR